MLPLLASLVNKALSGYRQTKRFRLEEIRLNPTSLVLELGISNVAPMVDGKYPLELHIKESTLESTVCELSLGIEGKMTRLVELGAKMIPRALLNEALQHFFGEGLRVVGDQVHIEHLALIRSLKRFGTPGNS